MDQAQLDAWAQREWRTSRRSIRALMVFMLLGAGVWVMLIYYAIKFF
jgi:hypothetical protein